ncbi:MAG: succinate dehydrogenase assembly factor 2 [Alphaproteobacteria bacterium]|nr:succinate dehydrogenase assembly factor 2 [Alphaproteobacteria bacterium]
MTENNDTKIKRILYRSWHRGCKETDILLGDFAKANLTAMSPDDISCFEQLLDEQDLDIYSWINHPELIPVAYQQMIATIKRFQEQRFE